MAWEAAYSSQRRQHLLRILLGTELYPRKAAGGTQRQEKKMENQDILIQFLDGSGWRVAVTMENGTKRNGFIIRQEMETVKRMYPAYSIRAVDRDGRLYDMLP